MNKSFLSSRNHRCLRVGKRWSLRRVWIRDAGGAAARTVHINRVLNTKVQICSVLFRISQNSRVLLRTALNRTLGNIAVLYRTALTSVVLCRPSQNSGALCRYVGNTAVVLCRTSWRQ